MTNETYITKYRPINLDEIIGHKAIVLSLKELLKNKSSLPHGFLFVGEPGCGKTSFSRILARELGCDDQNILEVDAGIVSGVDAMRELMSNVKYHGFGKSSTRCIIIDEVQRLSSAAWDSILKTLEEPPEHVYFCFCTTDGSKIPKAIANQRCHRYTLKEIKEQEICDYLNFVKENENLKLSTECLALISKECNGSPRQALSYLSQCRACTTPKEVADLIESAVENNEVIELCKTLMKKSSWNNISVILKNLKSQNLQPESVRINIANYFNACILNSYNDKEAIKFLTILNNFSKPIYENTGWVTLTLACGSVIYHE